MIEEQILKTIVEKINDDSLNLQIIVRDRILYLYINRDREVDLDYTWLSSTIHDAVNEQEEWNFFSIELYSRILGEVEPDWHLSIKSLEENLPPIAREVDDVVKNTQSLITDVEPQLKPTILHCDEIVEVEKEAKGQDTKKISSHSEPSVLQSSNAKNTSPDRFDADISNPNTNVESTENINSVQKETEDEIINDLSQYCFIRNKRLLEADIVAPSANIAQLIATFDKFTDSIQRSQLPLLEDYFKNARQPEITEEFELEVKFWWTEINSLDANPKRKFAIWLSRYCCDRENTMNKIESIFAHQEEVKKATEEEVREQARQKREAANKAYLENLQSSSNSNSKKSSSKPKKQSSKIIFLEVILSSLILIGITRPLSRLVFNGFSNLSSTNETVELNTKAPNESIKTRDRKKETEALVIAKNLFSSGLNKYRQKDFDKALDDFTDVIEIYEINPEEFLNINLLKRAYRMRGLAHYNLDDYNRAISDLTKAIEFSEDRDPYYAEYYADRGLAYSKLGNNQRALADINYAIELNPYKSDWYFYRGKIYYQIRDYELALKDLNQTIAFNSFYMAAYEQRYYVHQELGNLEQAEADYKKAKNFGYNLKK